MKPNAKLLFKSSPQTGSVVHVTAKPKKHSAGAIPMTIEDAKSKFKDAYTRYRLVLVDEHPDELFFEPEAEFR